MQLSKESGRASGPVDPVRGSCRNLMCKIVFLHALLSVLVDILE